MSRTRVIEVGNKYGSWTVIDYPYKSTKIHVRCDCGVEAWRFPANITAGKSLGCRACGNKRIGLTKTNEYSQEWQKDRVFAYFIGHTKTEFKIDKEQAWQVSQTPCWYCGVEPTNQLNYAGAIIYFSGIDRIDSSVGYVPGNIRPACWDCNRAKSVLTDAEFMSWLNRCYNNLAVKK